MRRQLHEIGIGCLVGLRRALLALLTVAFLLSTAAAADPLEQSFVDPPDVSRPWVYWFWMNGNITTEGITADLEAMRTAGIGGALIMHVGAGIPPGPVRFLSDEWRELFKYAVGEAERLGLEITMNACDGWTGTGGPWITPEEGMMKLVWTETTLGGPSREPVALPRPEAHFDVYHDVAVLAFPAPPAETAAAAAPAPTVTTSDPECDGRKLIDGDPSTTAAVKPADGTAWVQFQFAEPFTARGVSFVALTAAGLPARTQAAVSDDGRAFRPIAEATFGWKANIPSATITFEDATARYFRVSLPGRGGVFRELRLLGEGRVNNWELKSGFARRWGHGVDEPDFQARGSDTGGQSSRVDRSWERFAVATDRIEDLTQRMDPSSGRLDSIPLK